MENLSKSNLPPIFKLSNIVNILPYYGTLPQWMCLLKSLNRKSNELWGYNQESFITLGFRYRSEKALNLETFSNKPKEFLTKKYKFYKHFYLKHSSLFYLLKHYLPQQEDNMIFLLDISDKYEYDYTLSWFHKDKLSYHVPSVNCAEYKEEIDWFMKDTRIDDAIKFIEKAIDTEALILYRGIWIKRVTSPIFRFSYGKKNSKILQLKKLSRCSREKCWWKPSTLLTPYLYCSNNKHILDIAEKFESINKIKIWNNSTEWMKWIYGLKELLEFFTKRKDVKVISQNLKINIPGEPSFKFKAKTNKMILIDNEYVFPIKFHRNKIELSGAIKEVIKIENEDWIAIELWLILFKELNYQYDFSTESILKEFPERFNMNKKNGKLMYALLKTKDIDYVETDFPYNLAPLRNSSLCSSTTIRYNCKGYTLKELAYNLKLTPSNANLELAQYHLIKDGKSKFDANEFWSTIEQFSKTSFLLEDDRFITILEYNWDFVIESITDAILKIKIANEEKRISYRELIKMLS